MGDVVALDQKRKKVVQLKRVFSEPTVGQLPDPDCLTRTQRELLDSNATSVYALYEVLTASQVGKTYNFDRLSQVGPVYSAAAYQARIATGIRDVLDFSVMLRVGMALDSLLRVNLLESSEGEWRRIAFKLPERFYNPANARYLRNVLEERIQYHETAERHASI